MNALAKRVISNIPDDAQADARETKLPYAILPSWPKDVKSLAFTATTIDCDELLVNVALKLMAEAPGLRIQCGLFPRR